MKNNPSSNRIECEGCRAPYACTAHHVGCDGCGSACGNSLTRGFSRRAFLKIALAAGGLAGCSPVVSLTATPESSATPEPSATPTPVPEWRKVRDITAPKFMRYAAFHNEDYGVLLLTENQVYNTSDNRFTADGGQTWTAGSIEDNFCRFGLDIVDRNVLWNCGRGTGSGPAYGGVPPATGWKHAISRSTDGGLSWANAAPLDGIGQLHLNNKSNRTAGWACHVSFLDAKTGWVASCHPQLAATSDGGATWVAPSLPAGLTSIAAINCISEKTGALLDFQGNFYQTDDAGATWTGQALVHEEKQSMIPVVNLPLNVAAIRFTDPEHGLVAASLYGGGSSRLVVYRTNDGGRSWQTESIPKFMGLPYISRDGKYLTAVNFLDGYKLSLWAYS